ncbi:SDR family oxidoreductase [Streptomyces decoyicus]|uniref:SDR family oxidoreductase n=1 Tax=Streptomyces decoyicus TaxID=249567 RepID=UPI0033C50748
MLLARKTAIVHGGSGAVGAAVARAFAREGAAVHLTGRTVPPLEDVARRIPDLGGSHITWSALTGVCRQLAAELGPQGVRVSWLLSPGSPAPGEENRADKAALLAERPAYDDVANAAVFAASSWARTMTATELNLTGGLVPD